MRSHVTEYNLKFDLKESYKPFTYVVERCKSFKNMIKNKHLVIIITDYHGTDNKEQILSPKQVLNYHEFDF